MLQGSKKWLTTAEAAEALGTEKSVVLAMIKTGELAADTFGGNWAIPIESVESSTGYVLPNHQRGGSAESPKVLVCWKSVRIEVGL
jgi:excisionase family DNA binding protein